MPVPSGAGRHLPSAGDAVTPASAFLRWLGLAAGPLAALGLYAFLAEADGLSEAGRRTLAVAAWMAVWWITEALPIEATALLPLCVFPLVGSPTWRRPPRPMPIR
jgi:sodium-dependent dicarboxylate transporter 2/3/5